MTEFGAGHVIHARYRVDAPLGEGASAETLRCWDLERDHAVVLKLLKVERLDSWKHFEMFEREARVLATLRHHGVPKFFETFQIEGEGPPRLVLVQEFVEGHALAQRIASGPRLDRVQLMQLTLGILDVLEYLHGLQPPVYHRDIKPSNIVVRPSGAPVLIDFGGVCDGWRPAEGGSTVVGTHGYMPPEQYLGQVGPSSDFYALGATLLHAVGGEPPSSYSFDSGRIEVPENLPADPAILRLLTALLQPAPRDRPASVAQARALLLEPASSPDDAGDADDADQLPVLAKKGRLARRRTSDNVPRFVDLGPPGRDTEGPLAPVYMNLRPKHLRVLPLTRGKPGRDPNRKDLLVYLGMTLLTFGFWPLIALGAQVYRRRFHELFVNGHFAEGRIVSADQNGINFDFEVDGQLVRGRMGSLAVSGPTFGVGDRVGVLYDPEDPERKCAIAYG